MRLEILKPWRHCRVGTIIEPDAGVADILISKGIARVVRDEADPAQP